MINLRLNYPTVPRENEVIKEYLSFKGLDFTDILQFPDYGGISRNLNAAVKFLGIQSLVADNRVNILTCNSANHALSSVAPVLANQSPGIIAEPFVYQAFKAIAYQHGFHLHPAEFDDHGLSPESVREIAMRTKSRLLYVQPTIHNPTCVVMPLGRRQEIALVARELNLTLIEDDAYRFLHPSPPPTFMELVPEQTIHIYSLSKPFNSFIKTCYVVLPAAFRMEVVEQARNSSSGNSALLSDMSAYILEHAITAVIADKQKIAHERQQRVARILSGLGYKSHPNSFHLWMEVPEGIKSSWLTAKLLGHGVNLPSGLEFEVGNRSTGERYIRIALGAERDLSSIENGLQKLREIIG